MGVIAPAWYFAPQKNEVARAGWEIAAAVNGVTGEGEIVGFDDPGRATMLLQLAGEFADPETKQRIWDAAEQHIEPTWDYDKGEFTLGLGLNEAYPRGQLNARMMAGWVCTEGAWSRIFNEPNLAKFSQPTIEGVDFPSFALSEARWDGTALHIAVHGQNNDAVGESTTFRVTNIVSTQGWHIVKGNQKDTQMIGKNGYLEVTMIADNQTITLSP